MRFAFFPLHLSKVLHLPRKNHFSKPEDLTCTAPATQNVSGTGPTPAIVFGNATKPSHSAHF